VSALFPILASREYLPGLRTMPVKLSALTASISGGTCRSTMLLMRQAEVSGLFTMIG
jgi:hypothetical protein